MAYIHVTGALQLSRVGLLDSDNSARNEDEKGRGTGQREKGGLIPSKQ